MTSKSDILTKIRQQLPVEAPLPSLAQAWIQYADREQQFAEVLKSVGGSTLLLNSATDLEAAIRELPCWNGARQIVCNVPGLNLATLDLNDIEDPHFLADVDVAILDAQFAVAENGAVWLSDARLRHRAIAFIAQHVVLVVPRSELLDNLHQAYERIQFATQGYGVFISGPSKTADIEQSLVIGAHGPRSLTVALVGG